MTKRQPSVLAAWGVQERNYEETDCCIAFRGSNGSDRDANGSDHSMSQTKKAPVETRRSHILIWR